MRLGEEFLRDKGLYLGDKGFKIIPHKVEFSEKSFIFYHYTYKNFLENIFAKDNGLYARRPVSCPNIPDEFCGCYMVEGFLEPLPKWLTDDFYFRNLGMELTKHFIGNVLLKIELPKDFDGLYVGDYAHVLECKYNKYRGTSPLGLGYDMSNSREASQAYVNSYVPAISYKCKHIAPVVQVICKGKGIAVPNEYLSICKIQPL